ncbi:VOC family protein [Microbispora sp. CA-135349]|uniref:VOC family protein n=1 Tax=Microbispora sp. CA-135349 TaxID=3239953 RepID=UPI003D93524B
MTLTAAVLNAPDARELALFYQRLMGWPIDDDEPGWVTLREPGGGTGLSFQTRSCMSGPHGPRSPGSSR